LKIGNWFDDQLKVVIEAHCAGMNIKEVALKYNILYTTFQKHLFDNRVNRNSRAKNVMNHEEKKKLVDWLIGMTKASHRLSPTSLKM